MYWLANNIWTFGQQHYVFGKIEKEEEAKKQEALDRRSANAPAPGAKPAKAKQAAAAVTDDQVDGHRDDRCGLGRAPRRPRPNGAEAQSSRRRQLDGEPSPDAGPSDGPRTQTRARRQTQET